jgi:hypothetical protein
MTMSIEILRSFLLWCGIINYGLLIVWALVFLLAHDWLHRLTNKFFRLSVEQFDVIHYTAITLYKVAIFFFYLIPFVALLIVK